MDARVNEFLSQPIESIPGWALISIATECDKELFRRQEEEAQEVLDQTPSEFLHDD